MFIKIYGVGIRRRKKYIPRTTTLAQKDHCLAIVDVEEVHRAGITKIGKGFLFGDAVVCLCNSN